MIDESVPDDQPSYGLVVPFVVCQSKGGPYEDEAYVGGYEMGHLAARVGFAVSAGMIIPPVVVHRANQPQIDLLAMQAGLHTRELPWDESDGPIDEETDATWVCVGFEIPCDDEEPEL